MKTLFDKDIKSLTEEEISLALQYEELNLNFLVNASSYSFIPKRMQDQISNAIAFREKNIQEMCSILDDYAWADCKSPMI